MSYCPSIAEQTVPDRQHIVLELEFAAAEGRVALGVDRLIQFETWANLAHAILACVAVQPPEDESVEFRVVAGQFEPQGSCCSPQSDFDRFGGFDTQIGIADIESGGRIVCAARKQFGGFGRALDILAGDARDQIPGKILDQANARALRREVEVARCCGTDSVGIDVEVELLRDKGWRRSAQIGMLDAPGNLRLGGVGELQFVEDVSGDLGVFVRIPQTVDGTSDIVRARRRQFLMRRLNADRGGESGETDVERRKLHFDAAFLLLVGEGLPDAERRQIGRVGQPDFVVLIVGCTGPEPHGIDRRRIGPVFALGGGLGLMRVDAGKVIGAVETGDMIKRIGLRDRGTDETAIEDIGTADRCPGGLRRGIRLASVKWLGRVEQIRIARNIVVAGLAAVGVGMNRKIAAAGVEQNGTFDATIDRIDRGTRLGRHAARRFGICQRGLHRKPIGLKRRRGAGRQCVRNAIVAGADHAADRCGPVAQGCGSTNDFDLVCRNRIDGYEVIFAQIRRAVGANSVLDDPDAIDVEAADDRPAGRAGRKF